MDNFEDSRNALYVDPNAYIQKYDKPKKDNHRTKVVFQEPYECAPNYHYNNDFKKHDCNCVCHGNRKEDCDNKSPFDFKNILPMLSSLGTGGGFSDILKLLTNNGGNGLTNILSGLGNGGLSSLISGLDITKLFNRNSSKKPEIKSTEINIKDYTRVE